MEKKIGYKTRLDNLCSANLGEHKTDSYEQYKHYYWDKNWFPLIDYCMNDVRLTEELFRMTLNAKPIKYTNLQKTEQVVLEVPVAGNSSIEPDMTLL